jgi:hypothetical protein
MFLGLTLVKWKVENKRKIDLHNVEKVLKVIKSNRKPRNDISKIEETFISGPFSETEILYDGHNWNERENITCCDRIRISSSELVSEMYPFILGQYKNIQRKSKKRVYIKEGRRQLFLSQPESAGQVRGYSWGVNHSPTAKWGYIRSSKSYACPTLPGSGRCLTWRPGNGWWTGPYK